MKHLIQYTVFMFMTLVMISCKISTETTKENQTMISPQMQASQEQDERKQDRAQRTGLTQDDIQKIDDFAKKKAFLECKLKELDESASKALSDVAAKEIKDQITVTSDQFQALGKEIDAYCNTEPRQKYFYQIYKQYSSDCQ